MRGDVLASLFHLPLHYSCHISLVLIVFYFLLCPSLFSAFLPPSLSLWPPPPPPLCLPASLPLCLGKRRSRNKAINKKSTAFSVPPYYGFLMYASCCSITHQPQINALISPRRQIDFCDSDNGARSRSERCQPFSSY